MIQPATPAFCDVSTARGPAGKSKRRYFRRACGRPSQLDDSAPRRAGGRPGSDSAAAAAAAAAVGSGRADSRPAACRTLSHIGGCQGVYGTGLAVRCGGRCASEGTTTDRAVSHRRVGWLLVRVEPGPGMGCGRGR